MKGTHLSLNGIIVPYEEARIHVSSVAMKYGASVFEGVRGYWNREQQRLYLFALAEHLDRLFDSLRLMGMQIGFTREDVRQQVGALLEATRLREDCYVRIAGSIDVDGGIDASGPVLLNIAAFPQGRKPGDQGARLMVSAWRRLPEAAMPPRIKCVANYQNGRLAMLAARAAGYDGALLLDENARVSEAPTAAFFMVRGGVLCTPPTTAHILESITRRFVLQLAREAEIPAVERSIDRSECYLAEEAFLCGTGAEILPVRSIDQHTMTGGSPGPITALLQRRYFEAAYGRDDRHFSLLTTYHPEGRP
jgi:branched-chain amino acid aminotransferase